MPDKYSDLFPTVAKDEDSLDADVIICGAGIAGAAIAHTCAAMDPQCRVVVLEQYNYENSMEKDSQGADTLPQFKINHGSSRGGPRRIGLIGGDDKRIKKAWKAWQDMNAESPNKDLMDVAGEVYVFALFPFGWMFVLVFAAYFLHKRYIAGKDLPKGLQFLWTGHAVEKKLGHKQGFQPGCWNGCAGIYYEESAALHTDKILRYLLTESADQKNFQVRYRSKVTKIEQAGNDELQISVLQDGTKELLLRCRHLVLASGGWTAELLKQCLQDSQRNSPESSDYFDPDQIQTKIECFTCPVYELRAPRNKDEEPPLSLASACPLFSCVSKKLYGFPINYEAHAKNGENLQLFIRPFFKASDSQDPTDQSTCDEQRKLVKDFVSDCLAVDPNNISCPYYYTCRYPKLSLDKGKTFRPVFDFVPHSNQRIIVHAGLDGYSFKFGSVYGMEFMELLETGTPPKNCHWPKPKDGKKQSIFVRLFVYLARKEEANDTKAPADKKDE